jgi:hypothetical protein
VGSSGRIDPPPEPPLLSPHRARLTCLAAVVVALGCGGLVAAAALVPAPPGVLAIVLVVGIAYPMAASYQLHDAVVALRAHRRVRTALRRTLDSLPEVAHPLDW